MKKFRINLITVVALSLFSAEAAMGGASCTLTNYTIVGYDHGGAYMHGYLNGTFTLYMTLCGQTTGVTDCSTLATDRNLSIALTGQSLHKALLVYFESAASCSTVAAYSRIQSISLDY